MAEVRFRGALDDVLSGRSTPVMHFQPIADMRRGYVVGYEALVRFPAPPQLPPDRWFVSADVRSKRTALELLVARMAIASRDDLPPDTFLSVNVSPLFLMSEEWKALTVETGDMSRLVFEVTEGDPVRDYAALRIRLDEIRTRGGSIAVDDTGSGYASMKHVMELRPQFVKLDRFFIDGCHSEPAKSALIQMIGEAADRMDAWLVAEGIENEYEMAELMKYAVPLGQGYFLGRPAPEMKPLTLESTTALKARFRMEASEGLHRHLTRAVVCTSEPEAELAVAGRQRGVFAVVTDKWQRPIALFESHPLLGIRAVPAIMSFQANSPAAQVLRRALNRPLAQRFDTLVATSENGEYEGVMRIDDLTQVVMREQS